MQTGRPDLDARIRVSGNLPPEEPVFLIRGQDELGARAVRAYASLADACGVPPAVLESVLQQADAIERWPTKKLPDADHFDEPTRKQLEYRLSRRAWTRADVLLTDRELLAARRGADSERARLRPQLEAGAHTLGLLQGLLALLAASGRVQEDGAFAIADGEAFAAHCDDLRRATKGSRG